MSETHLWRRLDDDGAAPDRPIASAAPLVQRFETADETPVQPTLEPPVPPPTPGPGRERRRWPWLLLWLLALMAFLLSSTVVWVADLAERFGLRAAPLAITLALVLGGLAFWAGREGLALRRLGEVTRLRERLAAVPNGPAGERAFLALLADLEQTLPAAAARRGAVLRGDGLRDRPAADVVAVYDRVVVHPLDDLALAAVQRATFDIFFLVAVSPTHATDTVVFLARAVRMLRQVAEAYGQRPGRLVLLRLARRMLGDVTLISALSLVAGEMGRPVGHMAQQAGAALLKAGTNAGNPLSAALAMAGGAVATGAGAVLSEAADEITESAVAAIRLSQLGVLAMRECRPLPLEPARAEALFGRLRGDIMRLRRSPRPPVPNVPPPTEL